MIFCTHDMQIASLIAPRARINGCDSVTSRIFRDDSSNPDDKGKPTIATEQLRIPLGVALVASAAEHSLVRRCGGQYRERDRTPRLPARTSRPARQILQVDNWALACLLNA